MAGEHKQAWFWILIVAIIVFIVAVIAFLGVALVERLDTAPISSDGFGSEAEAMVIARFGSCSIILLGWIKNIVRASNQKDHPENSEPVDSKEPAAQSGTIATTWTAFKGAENLGRSGRTVSLGCGT